MKTIGNSTKNYSIRNNDSKAHSVPSTTCVKYPRQQRPDGPCIAPVLLSANDKINTTRERDSRCGGGVGHEHNGCRIRTCSVSSGGTHRQKIPRLPSLTSPSGSTITISPQSCANVRKETTLLSTSCSHIGKYRAAGDPCTGEFRDGRSCSRFMT